MAKWSTLYYGLSALSLPGGTARRSSPCCYQLRDAAHGTDTLAGIFQALLRAGSATWKEALEGAKVEVSTEAEEIMVEVDNVEYGGYCIAATNYLNRAS